jgi:phosphatidylglycerol:prolipoprotein diacylglycerol transferase
MRCTIWLQQSKRPVRRRSAEGAFRYTAAVIPFLHVWRLDVPTFGLMVALAMLAAYFMLRADLARRGTAADAETLIAVPCLAGILGAKLYHVLESPADFFADPWHQLFSQFGFAWFGGLIAGFAAFVWLARRSGAPLLEMMDAGSPAAALGYGVGRIGCFLSGDGDYGIPTSLPWGMSFPNGLVPTDQRVHPTPIYEFLAACAIAWWLWRMGSRRIATVKSVAGGTPREKAGALKGLPVRQTGAPTNANGNPGAGDAPRGEVFAAYLVLTGVARFLVEFIRINPRSVLGMSNAQAVSALSVVAGAALWWRVRRR